MKVKASALLLLSIVAFAPVAWATTARLLSNQPLAADADVIVIGRCVEVRTGWAAARSSPPRPSKSKSR